MVTVIGHRGAAVSAPENTLASFALAMDVGADGMECDVRATADGVPVILHDASVDRVTEGSGEVTRLTVAELQAFPFTERRDGYRDEFRGERIPTLAQLLDLVAGKKLIVLEFKTLDAVAPAVPILRARGAAAWCTAWSFSAEILAALKAQVPELSRSQNIGRVDSWDDVLATARELQCIGVSVNEGLVDAARTASAKALGLKFYTWTPNGPEAWRRVIDAGVDGVCTDDPGGLRRHLAVA